MRKKNEEEVVKEFLYKTHFGGGKRFVREIYCQENWEEGKPECVLIRALDLGKLTDGPGKVCRYLKLDKSFYGEDLTKSKRIWLEDLAPEQVKCRAGRGVKRRKPKIITTVRIGIDYAGPYWSQRKWRFVLKPKINQF